MMEQIKNFYESIKSIYSLVLRTKSKTISTREFKQGVFSLYESWKTEIEHLLKESGINKSVLSKLDDLFQHLYAYAKLRVAEVSDVKECLDEINDIFLSKIFTVLKKIRKREPYAELAKLASFLGLDKNWFLATCALQLQEVAITLFANQKCIKLDKKHVERILNRKIDILSFNGKYEAFSKEMKRLYNVDMPILTTQFRKIRAEILHKGYNPEPEETNAIIGFTLGLLQKLRDLS